jgi:4-aminobutyrate aminotransferase-like enzyme
MEVLLEEGLIGQVANKSALFLRQLKHPAIKSVRHCGLLIAVELGSAGEARLVIDGCIRRGLLTDWFLFAPHCLRIAPPLTITEDEIGKACSIILESLEE